MSKYAGADWVEAATKQKLSPVGRAAADLLGDVFLGIYHLPMRSLQKVEWQNPSFIEITIDCGLSTYDDDLLTRIVLLAHDRVLRVHVRGVANGYMRMMISQRRREGDLYNRHPAMEEHIKTLREHYHNTRSRCHE